MNNESNNKNESQNDLKKVPGMLNFLSEIPMKMDTSITIENNHLKNQEENESPEKKSGEEN